MVLIKSVYSFYFAILVFLFLKRKYLTIIQSVLIHFIPIIIWLLILKANNLQFYSATMYGEIPGHVTMVTWFLNDLVNFNFEGIFRQFIKSFIDFLLIFIKYYNFLLIFIFIGLFIFLKKEDSQIKKDILLFSFLAIFLSFIQLFMTQKGSINLYMGGDYFLICLFYILISLQKVNPKKFMVAVILIFIFSINTIRLPYVLPFDQEQVTWKNKFKPNSKSLKYFD